MKIYRGIEIMDIIDVMDKILFESSLSDFFDNSEHHYRDLVEDHPYLLNDMMCFMSDDNQSYMFIDTDDYDYTITIAMWVGRDNTVGFKETMRYFNAIRNVYKGMTDTIRISANCKITTSLPIVKKLDGRKGIHVAYIGEECGEFAEVRMVCNI